MDYTNTEQQLIDHTKNKIIELFKKITVPAHGIDHVLRVVENSKTIAIGEHARSPLLCELAAWTHDVGRTREDVPGEASRKHHELSYEILREWFSSDKIFDLLSDDEKKNYYTV